MPLPEGTLQGTILKGIGGFYYVEAADTVYECKEFSEGTAKSPLRATRLLSSPLKTAPLRLMRSCPEKIN